jgi:hypothetical protein
LAGFEVTFYGRFSGDRRGHPGASSGEQSDSHPFNEGRRWTGMGIGELTNDQENVSSSDQQP